MNANNISTATPLMENHPITIREVKKRIAKLKSGKTAGIDGISNEMIKASIDILAAPLAKLMNIIAENGTYPETLWGKALWHLY